MAKGIQVPSFSLAPKSAHSSWADVSDLCEAYGLVLDEWQRNVLKMSMGETAEGKWAATRVGLAVPRQSGKTALFEARELAGLLLFGEELILHSAHLVPTALEAFLRIKAYFENFDDLGKKVRRIREANGEQGIEMMNGQRLKFVARSKGGGRGFSADALLLDECQELPDLTWAAMLPTVSARPNPQIWLAGTPPGPNDNGEVFTRTRDIAHTGKDKRLAWAEWSVSGDVDLDDRKLWRQANPAVGTRITEDHIQDERNSMDDMTFARERLGMWASDEQLSVIPADAWNMCGTGSAPEDLPSVYAVDMNHERTRAIVAVGVSGTRPHVEVAKEFDITGGSAELLAWLLERTNRRIPVLVDAMSPARSIVPGLQAKNRKVIVTSTAESMQACGGFYDAVLGGELSHFQQKPVENALIAAKKKKIGDAGGWVWDRKSVDVFLSPLIGVTLAHFGAVKFGKRRSSSGSSRGKVLVLS